MELALIASPCKDCKGRHMLCHSECDKYLEYRRKLDEINEKLAFENMVDGYNIDSVRKAVKRNNKKR